MNLQALITEVALGEDSIRQFKSDVRNSESLAAEIAAFSNSNGGQIFIGISDGAELLGLSKEDVSRINQLISNASRQRC